MSEDPKEDSYTIGIVFSQISDLYNYYCLQLATDIIWNILNLFFDRFFKGDLMRGSYTVKTSTILVLYLSRQYMADQF